MRRAIAVASALLAGVVLSAAPDAVPAQHPSLCHLTTTGRIVAIGDVHGAFDRFVTILRQAQLVDSRRHWIGGKAILVQLGDVLDRGPESRQALDLIRHLEDEAARAGGGVVFLLGDHEVMRMAGDYHDVTAAEYAAFKDRDSSAVRERLYEHVAAERAVEAQSHGQTFDAGAFRKTFLDEIPLGSAELQMAFAESGAYGGWLRQHDVMAIINGTIFVHSGPAPAFAGGGCEAVNARGHQEMQTLTVSGADRDTASLWNVNGPLRYQGLVSDRPDAAASAEVAAVLSALGGTRMVVGHTVSPTGRIRSLFQGRVLQIDTGMLGGSVFPGGVASALELQGDTMAAIYDGKHQIIR